MSAQVHKTHKLKSVGFNASTESHSSITVKENEKSSNVVDVNAGFLKILHKYAINFTVPNVLNLSGDVNVSSPSVGLVPTKIHVQDNGIAINLEYKAEHKEGVIIEKFGIVSETDKSKEILINLHLEILGKNQGTPSLKNEVHCIEHYHEYDTDQSDWQGFN